jgi:hypothetical protein
MDDVDPDYRKGKRPARHEDVPFRFVHEPPDGSLASDCKLHKRHVAKARALQSDLNAFF